jgi:hypothetical protein
LRLSFPFCVHLSPVSSHAASRARASRRTLAMTLAYSLILGLLFCSSCSVFCDFRLSVPSTGRGSCGGGAAPPRGPAPCPVRRSVDPVCGALCGAASLRLRSATYGMKGHPAFSARRAGRAALGSRWRTYRRGALMVMLALESSGMLIANVESCPARLASNECTPVAPPSAARVPLSHGLRQHGVGRRCAHSQCAVAHAR